MQNQHLLNIFQHHLRYFISEIQKALVLDSNLRSFLHSNHSLFYICFPRYGHDTISILPADIFQKLHCRFLCLGATRLMDGGSFLHIYVHYACTLYTMHVCTYTCIWASVTCHLQQYWLPGIKDSVLQRLALGCYLVQVPVLQYLVLNIGKTAG